MKKPVVYSFGLKELLEAVASPLVSDPIVTAPIGAKLKIEITIYREEGERPIVVVPTKVYVKGRRGQNPALVLGDFLPPILTGLKQGVLKGATADFLLKNPSHVAPDTFDELVAEQPYGIVGWLDEVNLARYPDSQEELAVERLRRKRIKQEIEL